MLAFATRSGNVFNPVKLNTKTIRLERIGILPEAGEFILKEGIPAVVSVEWFSSAVMTGCLETVTIPARYLR